MQTLAVKALSRCNGSPKASSDNGCPWYWTFGQRCRSDDRAKAPSCDGDMLIGPLRESRYCSPMRALPCQVFASVFSVRVPLARGRAPQPLVEPRRAPERNAP